MTARRALAGMALSAIAIACVAWPLFDLVVAGPFAWHFRQASAVHGGIEVLALALLLFAALSLPASRWRLPLAGVVLAAYLRRHHADFVAFVALFQLELLLAAGASVLRLVRAPALPARGDGYLRAFVTGIGVLVSIHLVSSLAGNGRAADLRALTVIVAVPLFAYARLRPLAWHCASRAAVAEPGLRALAAAFVAWIAASFARTGNVLAYDSLWYGLRGHLVLAPQHSLFDATGLVSPVHYFPKLYELLLLPLNGIGTYQHATGLATAMLVMVALAAWRFARALGASEREAGWAVLLATTLPAVANHGLMAKPDLLALALLLAAARFVLAHAASRRHDDALLALAALLLAVQARIGTGLFCAALGAVLVVSWLRPRAQAPVRAGAVALALAVVVSGVLTTRTLLLAGVPTIGPDPLLALWLALGFQVRDPVGTLDYLQPQVWSDVPLLVRDLLFAPTALPHVQIAWTGNAWLWCAFAAFAARCALPALRARPVATSLLAGCAGVGLWLALGQRWMVHGGDGNYFMFAPVLALLALVPLVLRRVRSAAVPWSLALFALMQAWYAFTSAGWGTPGTRAWDLDFTRGPDRVAAVRRAKWQEDGLLELAAAVSRERATLHLVGDIPEGGGLMLPVRYEPLSHIFFAHGDRFASVAQLQALLDSAGVDALVVPAPGLEDPARILPVVLELTAHWRADPAVRRVRAGRWQLLVREAPR